MRIKEMDDTKIKLKKSGKDDQVYFINGVKVPFPAKAYPTQIAMMHKILKGLDKKQNCLLESPTGSGKTLALLCSCLAWQRSEKEKAEAIQNQEKSRIMQQLLQELDDDKTIVRPDVAQGCNEGAKQSVVTACNTTIKDGASNTPARSAAVDWGDGHSDDMDFQSAKKRFRTPTGGLPSAKRQKQSNESKQESGDRIEVHIDTPPQKPTWRIEANENAGRMDSNQEEKLRSEKKARKLLDDYNSDEDLNFKEEVRIPKIFFGTRTHKQITQIIRELKKTDFNKASMTILSSREHSCIHPEVSKSKDKNEECRRHMKGLDGKICKFYGNSTVLSKRSWSKKYNLCESWDIEDLVKAGKKAKACPYYAAREMMIGADIIFCPYNYLVSPFIRAQMDINLKDEIVVLDEAHNIEDSAREAASASITSVQLEDVIAELDKLVMFKVMSEEHGTLRELCTIILNWIVSLSDVLKPTGFEEASKILTGNEMAERMRLINITASNFPKFEEALSQVNAAEYDTETVMDIDQPTLSNKGTTVLRILMTALSKVLDEATNFSEDFKIAVSKKSGISRRQEPTIGGWRTTRNNAAVKTWIFSLNFWCLNPAVIFSEIGNSSRCIILTSGTLSPMNSFSSELGVKFPIQLEANHVIPDSQVWVGALTVGTDNNRIKANFQTSETFAFQDEVGKVILQVCQIVPRGVLCFFPSYSMLEKLKKRWQITGFWGQILDVKMIYAEPRGSDRAELDAVMGEYYQAANDKSVTGALLLAVCRGKVSEGLDFTDDNARAVITIGIPFPDFKDTQVELKRNYNNKHSKTRGLLTGTEWYEIQAYRALNQALGRCIRHKKDWGAILLLDERFGQPKYKRGLSRWVRGRCKTFTEFSMCISSLKSFAEAREINPCPDVFPETRPKVSLVTSTDTKPSASSAFTKNEVNANAGSSLPTNLLPNYDNEKSKITNASLTCAKVNVDKTKEAIPSNQSGPKFTTDAQKGDGKGYITVNATANLPGSISHNVFNHAKKWNSNFSSKALGVTELSATGSPQKSQLVKTEGAFGKMSSIVCNRSKLFKTSQTKIQTSSSKLCDVGVELSAKKEEPNVIEIDNDDDAINDENVDEIKKCAFESKGTPKLADQKLQKCSKDPNTTPKVVNDLNAAKLKDQTPILFSENATEIDSFEDQFWEYSDAEMSEMLSENISDQSHKIPDTNIKRNEGQMETKSGDTMQNCDYGIQKQRSAVKHTETRTDFVMKEEYDAREKLAKSRKSGQDMNKTNDIKSTEFKGNRGLIDSKLPISDQPSIDRKRCASKKKSNIRMAARSDRSDFLDYVDSDEVDSNKQIQIKCSYCHAHFLNHGIGTRKRVNAPIISKFLKCPGKDVEVIEATCSSLQYCTTMEHGCNCETRMNGIKLNATFCEKEDAVYVPLLCLKCCAMSTDRRLVGFRIINVRPGKTNANENIRVYFLTDQVYTDDEYNNT